jgi:ribosomal protein S18 acetylase RimI-like enzyme
MAKAARARDVEIRPLTPGRADDVKIITASTWGSQCFDLWWRFTKPLGEVVSDSSLHDAGITGAATSKDKKERQRCAILAKLARRRHAPVLVAYNGDGEPVGFVSLGPRSDYERFRAQRTTQPVDDVPAWVIPCVTVRKAYRGEGIALALLRAAVEYAGAHGAPAIEGYPRADRKKRFDDGSVYMGTPALFRRAGFRQIRGVEAGMPGYYAPRVTMRATTSRQSARGGGRLPKKQWRERAKAS